ncbi:MAG: tetratricopeptide repeat protein [Methylococcales bacterium]
MTIIITCAIPSNIHLPAVRQAIQAYCRGDDRMLADLLAQISFHSPYRDIRSILSALTTHASGTGDAAERLAKISGNSAFKPVARIVEQAVSGPLNPASLADCSEPARAFILAVQGIDKRNWDLAEKISRPPSSAKKLFSLLINDPLPHASRLVQSLCHHLLPQYPYGIPAYQNQIRSLETFEIYRINALALERREDYDTATKAWIEAAGSMVRQDDNRRNRLIRAMFLRRAADCADQGSFLFSTQEQDCLEESLEFDPEDLPTFYRLFKIYKDLDDDAYYSCVERAVKQFPEDSGVLMVAIELAIERDTFKKATKYANTLLTLDPINQRARALLVKAHLAHARKQITQKKFKLAVKEIDAAEEFEPGNHPSGLIPLHRGLLEYAQGNETQGERMIDLACNMIGGYLRGYFRTAVEMTRLELSPRYRKKYLMLLRNESANPPDQATFLGLIKELQQLSKEKDVEISAVMAALKKTLSAATSLDLGCEEMERVCDTFETLELYQQLADFAAEAVKRWPDTPVFDYFLIYARSRGVAANMSALDSDRLEAAIDKAHEQKNIRVANRMIDYFESGVFQRDFAKGSPLPAKLHDVIEQFVNDNPDLAKKLKQMFGDEDHIGGEVPVRPRKPRRKSSASEPFNLDIFDDQSF